MAFSPSLLVLLVAIGAVQGAICPDNFEAVGDNCYYFSQDHGDTRIWEDARTFCHQLDADLAVLDLDCKDSDRLIKYIISQGYSNMFMGASDEAQEGFWTWIDGRPVDMKSKFWSYYEPDYPDSNDCAMLSTASQDYERRTLYDWPCTSSLYYVCQYGIHSRL